MYFLIIMSQSPLVLGRVILSACKTETRELPSSSNWMGWKMYVFRSQALLGYVSQLGIHANCFAYITLTTTTMISEG